MEIFSGFSIVEIKKLPQSRQLSIASNYFRAMKYKSKAFSNSAPIV